MFTVAQIFRSCFKYADGQCYFNIYSLIVEGASHGDPVEVILSSPALILTGVCWAVLTAACLYL